VLDGPEEVVTVNGIIKAIALVHGVAAGTWKMPGGEVELDLWREPSRATMAALEREASAVRTY